MLLPRIILFIAVMITPLISNQLDSAIIHLITGFTILIFLIVASNSILNIRPLVFSPISIIFLIFLISISISTLFSQNFSKSIPQLILYADFFIIFQITQLIFQKRQEINQLISVIAIISGFLSIMSLYNTLVLQLNSRIGEFISFYWASFGHNHFSALLIFSTPLSFYFFATAKSKQMKVVTVLIILLMIVSLYFTFARISVFSLLFAFLLAIIVYRLQQGKSILLTLIFSIVLIAILFNRLSANSWVFNVKKYEKSNVAARFIYWNQAINNFMLHPLTGSGLGTFIDISKTSEIKSKIWSGYTHNHFLQMLSDAGIFAFLLSVTLIGSALFYGYKKIKSLTNQKDKFLHIALWIGLTASTINALFDFDWQLPTVFLWFWVIAGVVLNYKTHETD